MPNTTKKLGKIDIKTFTKSAVKKPVLDILELLNVHDEESYNRAVDAIGDLMDITGDDASTPLNMLIDRLVEVTENYERKQMEPIGDPSPVESIKFFLEVHDLKQADIADLFGGRVTFPLF